MPGDIFATKGTEYLLVILYFALLVVLVKYLAPRATPAESRAGRPAPVPRREQGAWFAVAEGYHFHPGHGWATPEDGDTLYVGLDDFAARLVGTPERLALPAVGARVRQGEKGWDVETRQRTLPMISPVDGEVVEVNPAVVASPQLAADDPYGEGWLFKVRTPDRRVTLRNLLSGELAAAWMRHTAERLRRLPGAELGIVMPDGGAPVRGFGLALDPVEWDAVAREFFLTD